jgi:ABC-2 type transport system permease protein
MYGVYTLFFKEVLRFWKVAFQTVLAPVITALLYLVIFSHVLEDRVKVFEGVEYTAFLIPGLMMMSIIQNAFANSSSSLIQSKVTGNIVFLLLTPLTHFELFVGYVAAAVVRGFVVGAGVFLLAVFYVHVPVHSVVVIIGFAILSSSVLAVMGMIAGIWAEKFDQLAAFQNFIIMPLSFLSGVFYSVHSLPPLWQTLSHFNPFFYMIDGFRYGFFGQSDVVVEISFLVVVMALLVLSALTLVLLKSGYKLRA